MIPEKLQSIIARKIEGAISNFAYETTWKTCHTFPKYLDTRRGQIEVSEGFGQGAWEMHLHITQYLEKYIKISPFGDFLPKQDHIVHGTPMPELTQKEKENRWVDLEPPLNNGICHSDCYVCDHEIKPDETYFTVYSDYTKRLELLCEPCYKEWKAYYDNFIEECRREDEEDAKAEAENALKEEGDNDPK